MLESIWRKRGYKQGSGLNQIYDQRGFRIPLFFEWSF